MEMEEVLVEPLLRCSLCKQEKPTREFDRDSTTRRGYGYYCKPCARAVQKSERRSMATTERTKGTFAGVIPGTKSKRAKPKQRVITPDTEWCVTVRDEQGTLHQELRHGSYHDCLRRLSNAPLPAFGLHLQLEPKEK